MTRGQLFYARFDNAAADDGHKVHAYGRRLHSPTTPPVGARTLRGFIGQFAVSNASACAGL